MQNDPPSRFRSTAVAYSVDQVLSSLANFLVLFAALRTLPLATLGSFTLAYNGTILLLGLVRPLSLEPLLVRVGGSSEQDRRRAIQQASGLSLAVGLSFAVIALVMATARPSSTGNIFLLASVAALALLVQDAWRYYFFATRRPWAAALNDGVCLVCTGAAMAVTLTRLSPSASLLLAVWGLGGLGAALFGLAQIRTWPSPRMAGRWLKSTRNIGPAFFGEIALERAANQIALVVLGLLASTAAVGMLGAARTVMTPVTTVVSAAAVLAVPEAARRLKAGDVCGLRQFSVVLSGSLAVIIMAFTTLTLLLPSSIGRLVFGLNWDAIRPLLLPTGIWTAAIAARNGPRASLRAMEKGSSLLRLSIVASSLVVIGATLGGYLAQAGGAAWALAASSILSLIFYWYVHVVALHPNLKRTRS